MNGPLSLVWRNLRYHKRRVAVTAFAVALGVANLFGVLVANTSINREMEHRARAWTGGADVVVRPAEQAVLSSSEVEGLRILPGVRQLFVESIGLPLTTHGGARVAFARDIDRIGARQLLARRLRQGRLPRPGTHEVALAHSDARHLRLGIGDRVIEWDRPDHETTGDTDPSFSPEDDPATPINRRTGIPFPLTLKVTGILEDARGSGLVGGPGSYTVELSRAVYEPWHAVRALVFLDSSVDPSTWAALQEGTLSRLRFEPASGPVQLREALSAVQNLLTGTSALALFVGAFLVYLIFSLALVERTRMYGLLHAVGASPRQVAGSVFREGLALGSVATTAGLVLGVLLAAALLAIMAGIGQLDLQPPLTVTTWSVAASVAVGLGATAAGVSAPALRASRLSPVEAIRGSSPAGPKPRAWAAGIILLVGGVVWVITKGVGNDISTQVAVVVVLLGTVLSVPAGVGGLARLTRSAAERLAPGLGQLAVAHVTRERSRSAYTLALVMVVLASMFTLQASNLSLRRMADRWLDARFGADLILYGTDASADPLETTRGVEGVSGATSIEFGQRIAITAPRPAAENLLLIDPDEFFEIAGFPWADGSDEEARQSLSSGGSVLIPSRSAGRLGVQRGDKLRLAGPLGERHFSIAGIYLVPGQGPEIGLVAAKGDASFFGDTRRETALYLNFADSETIDTMASRLHAALEPQETGQTREPLAGPELSNRIGPYFAISGTEIKQQARAELDSWIRLFTAVLLIVVIVGTLGMGVTMATSVMLRSKEIGVIQAVGATPGGVRRLVMAESLTLVSAAFVLALGLGILLSWMFVEGMNATLAYGLGLALPWRFLPVLAVVSLVIAVAAAHLPARRAARLSPVEALRYE